MFPILFVFCFYSDFYLLFVSCVLCSWSWKWRTTNTKCPVCINSLCLQACVSLDLSCVCVCFGNVCVQCEFNWLRCAVFLLKAHTTMGCVSESRLGKCVCRDREEDNRMLPNVDQTHCNVLVLLFRPHLPAAPCITLDSLWIRFSWIVGSPPQQLH